MKLYFTFTRKSMAAVLAAILLIVLGAGEFYSAASRPQNADTHSKRMSFLESLGVLADAESCETKNIIIPESFSAVYNRYNELQKKSGYDLLPYRGCKAVQYTYKMQGAEDTYIHLLVYKGRIIGGDIAQAALNGKMTGLVSQK